MKTILFCFFLSILFRQSFAADYYSQGSASPSILSGWNENPQGGGAAPVSFTNPGDKFIIQTGHTMITTAIWIVGSSGSILEIQNGGTLQGNHIIMLSGSFQIDDGGTYIHNNNGSVDETSGNSIFGGDELFAADSHFEIRNWAGKNVGLPNAGPGISWGDLIINLQADISADALPWNWNISDGSTLTIKGDLDIRATFANYVFHTELCFSTAGIQIINVGGDFLMSGNKSQVSLKGTYTDGYVTMQVNGNILLKDMAQLNLGLKTTDANPYGLYELRFRGNFSAIDYAILIYDSYNPAYLVANGNSPQTFICKWNFNRNFKVAAGATVNLAGALSTTAQAVTLAILGTLNQNGNNITTYGTIETAAGTFNASGNLIISGSCVACSNLNSAYNYADRTWCTASGVKGRNNFTNSTVTLDNREYATIMTAGSSLTTSPGEIYLSNSTAVSYSNISPSADVCVEKNSVLSLDANSYLGGGGAKYSGKGGTLRIGSKDGITETGNTTYGNVRTGLSKDYDFAGSNSFEYIGLIPQVTGNGLPSTIGGTLKINNTAGAGTTGVTLSQSTLVKSGLNLVSGKLTTSISNLLTLDKNALVNVPFWGASFVSGPMKKIGNTTFIFPVGKGNNFAPVTLSDGGLITDEFIAEYFMADPVQTIGSSFDNPPVNLLSKLEWWEVGRSSGTSAKTITLEATTYTDAMLLSDLRIMRWDGLAWRNEGNTGFSGISAGQVTSNIVNDFFATGTPTPFTFGSISFPEDPLSINLLFFDAIKITNTKALVNWELGNYSSATAKFDIEKSYDNSGFNKITTVNGNTTSRYYNYTDNDLKKGVSYYRLKMADENGRISYSRVAIVMNELKGLLLSLTPTIVRNTAVLSISSANQQKLDIVITDMQGRILQKQFHLVNAGNTTIQLSTDQLAAGVYQLFGITEEGKTNVIRFIKQ